MCRDFGGQTEVKTCAARRVVGSPQAAAMRFNDGAADGQSHTDPMKLRGKEGIEDLVRLYWQPHAGIADGHHKLPLFRSLRLDGELARPIQVLHRIDAVTDEVHHDLLQLHAISHDLGKICRQLRRTDMEYRTSSPRRRRIISPITSFTSNNSRWGVPFSK